MATNRVFANTEILGSLSFNKKLTIALISLLSSGFGVPLLINSYFPAYAVSRLSVVLLCLALIISIVRSKELPSEVPRTLVVTMAFIVISIVWAPNKYEAFFAAVSISMIWLGGWSISRADKLVVLRVVRNVLSLGLLASFIAWLVYPEITFGKIERLGLGTVPLYHGLWNWNSEIAVVSGLVLISSIVLHRFEKLWISSSVIFLALANLIVSNSALTFISIAIAGFLGLIFLKTLKKIRLYLLFGFLTLAIVMVNALPKITDEILLIVGKDSTFSGRSAIWQVSFAELSKSPVFGFGIGNSPNLSSYFGWTTHAHNGFLAVSLELGAIGLILIILLLKASFQSAIKSSDVNGVPILVFIVSLNFGNDFLMSANVLVFILASYLRFNSSNSISGDPNKNK